MEPNKVKRLPETFGLRFGLIAPSFAKQIKAQGLKYDPAKVSRFEKCRDGIMHLLFNSIITDSQQEKLQLKLYNKILIHVGKENNCSVKIVTHAK